MSEKPSRLAGLHHVALNAKNYVATREFYVQLLGFEVEWEPDDDNVYLTSGTDNLAIHRISDEPTNVAERLDHIGMLVDEISDVDRWYDHLVAHNIEIVAPPRTHRDGARSFYCKDPNGTVVQVIFHPPLANKTS